MPYIPKNLYPKNITVDKRGVIEFKGMYDEHDNVENIYIDFMNKNNAIATIDLKNKKIADINGNDLKDSVELISTNFVSHSNEFGAKIQIKKTSQKDEYIVVIDKVEFINAGKIENSRIYPQLQISINIKSIDNQSQISDILTYRITPSVNGYERYYRYEYDWDTYSFYEEGNKDMGTGNYYDLKTYNCATTSQKGKVITGGKATGKTPNAPVFISLLERHNGNYSGYREYDCKVNGGIWNLDINNTYVQYEINGKTYSVLIQADEIFSGNFNIEDAYCHETWYDNYGADRSYTISESYSVREIDAISYTVSKQSSSVVSYLSDYNEASIEHLFNQNQFTWQCRVQSDRYDTYILEDRVLGVDAIASKLKIPVNEFIKTGQKFNDQYFVKLIGGKYYNKIGTCTLKQTYKSATSYTYEAIFNFILTDLIKYDLENNVEDVYLYLGTEEILLTDATYSGTIVSFNKNYPLLSEGKTESQEVVFEFLRNTSYIQLYENDELISVGTSFMDMEFNIKTNTIVSPIMTVTLGIVPSLYYDDIIQEYKTLSLKGITNSDLQQWTIGIYSHEDDDYYEETKNGIQIDFNYPYLYRGEKYTLYERLRTKEGLEYEYQIKDIICDYDIDDVFVDASYIPQKHCIELELLTPIMTNWIDSNFEVWLDSNGKPWTSLMPKYEEQISQGKELISIYANIYRYRYENNDLKYQLLIGKDIKLVKDLNSDYYTTKFYDYGVNKETKYQYEIIYKMNFGENKVKKSFNYQDYLIDLVYNNKGELETIENVVEYYKNEDNSYTLTLLGENENTSITIFIFENYVTIDEEIIDFSFIQNFVKNTSTITSSRLSPPIFIKDWIGVVLYGTTNNYSENQLNRYQIDPQQEWYFAVDTQADTIDFINERNIFTNLSSFPKVGISKVDYMTQSITTKLGYMSEEDLYVEDNGYKLDQFRKWANNNTVKILRLPNGYLIPVNIQLKNRTANYKLSAEPSEITFQWTQIADHTTAVLYDIKQESSISRKEKVFIDEIKEFKSEIGEFCTQLNTPLTFQLPINIYNTKDMKPIIEDILTYEITPYIRGYNYCYEVIASGIEEGSLEYGTGNYYDLKTYDCATTSQKGKVITGGKATGKTPNLPMVIDSNVINSTMYQTDWEGTANVSNGIWNLNINTCVQYEIDGKIYSVLIQTDEDFSGNFNIENTDFTKTWYDNSNDNKYYMHYERYYVSNSGNISSTILKKPKILSSLKIQGGDN